MRRISVFLVMCMICTLPFGAVAEPAADVVTGYGPAGEMAGWVSVYCNEWNDIIGSVFGSDMSYDADNFTIIEKRVDGATMDIDGIIMDVDYDLNVLSMRVNLTDKSRDTYADLSRCLAMVATLSYDLPESRLAMKNRFIALMEEYMKGIEFHNWYADLKSDIPSKSDSSEYSTEAKFLDTTKGSDVYYFCSVGGNLYFSTDDLVE